MFEFARRVGLGVDVADFLELERPLQCNRVVQPPAQEQGVFHAGEILGPTDDLGVRAPPGLAGFWEGGGWLGGGGPPALGSGGLWNGPGPGSAEKGPPVAWGRLWCWPRRSRPRLGRR